MTSNQIMTGEILCFEIHIFKTRLVLKWCLYLLLIYTVLNAAFLFTFLIQ